MKRTAGSGSTALVQALTAEGIDHVFGIIGTHNSPLYDALLDESSLRPVFVRHEQGAAMMAAGYARASGKIAACFVVPGPGLTNALTGMGMAYSESVPMLVIAGQNTVAELDRPCDSFHELANSVVVANSVSGFATRVDSPGAVPQAVRAAMQSMCCQRARPAYIELPLDVQTGACDALPLPPEPYARPTADDETLRRAATALRSARRPCIFVGGAWKAPRQRASWLRSLKL